MDRDLLPFGTIADDKPTLLLPISGSERVLPIDVLRGFALLGILVINIGDFALPSAAFTNPTLWGGFYGWNYAAWLVGHLVFDQKMISIFSMLFGAGLVLMTSRSEARGISILGIYYRRILWLLVFGLLHAYLLWEGDILYSYAVCGLILYPFRRLAPGKLILLGLVVFLLSIPINSGAGLLARWFQDHPGADWQVGRWEPNPTLQHWLRAELKEYFDSSDQKAIDQEINTYRSDYWTLLPERAGRNLESQTIGFAKWAGPRAGGLMVLGMGLMKLGIFSARRSVPIYVLMAVLGYGVGLPLIGYGIQDRIAHDFDPVYEMILGGQYNYVGSLFVALGHVGVFMLICKAGKFPRLTARLAAVGRMALTNYLMQTLICSALFFGWGLGLFARLDRIELAGVVVAIWLWQLLVAPVWLHYFRFGPMEWLWRSLTYGMLQPLLATR